MANAEAKLGDYLILERIAHGGMAQIYKAKTADPVGIERFVVIKRILPHIASNPEYIEMLVDEAKIAVHFTHGNIAQIYDLGKAGDDYFIVMEYVDGKTLGQILREFKERKKNIPIEVVVFCLIEICKGLDYIHNKTDAKGKPLGVIHRDISPQNIIVSYSGTVKIIDFGVAKAKDKDSHTESGVLKGKFAYMSPEQAEGDPIDRRSDIFSAGVLLWELLTGQRLFKRKNNQETIKAVRRDHVLAPSKIRREVPRDLDQIISKALQKKKHLRYQRASEMADDLNHFLAKNYPEFRPFHVTQFLYRYFGPEPDEEGLPPELPQLVVEQEPKVVSQLEEEKTERETKISVFSKLKAYSFYIVGGTFALIGFLIISYTAFVHFFQGTLNLIVNPSLARVYINGGIQKPENQIYQIHYRSDEPFHLSINLNGYVPIESTLMLHRGETRSLSMSLNKEIPPYGDILVVSNPPGAFIYIDDKEYQALTPTKISGLDRLKKYKIGVFLDGYVSKEQEMTPTGGETTQITFDLEANFGSLEINSSPEGARVIINTQDKGTTPIILQNMKPGDELDLNATLNGFESVHQSIQLKPGEKKQILFELKKLDTANLNHATQ